MRDPACAPPGPVHVPGGPGGERIGAPVPGWRFTQVTSPLVGRPAAAFALRDTAGREHRLDGYRGRWLLLVLHRHLF